MSPLPKTTRRPTVAYWPTEQELRVMDALETRVSRPRPARKDRSSQRKPLIAVLAASVFGALPMVQGQSF